jgi:hypothetical protein
MTLKDHKEFYDMVCKEAIDGLKDGQETIIDILKGKNGAPGLCDDVRGLKKTYRNVMAVGVFILTILGAEVITWLWSDVVVRLFGG